LTPTERVNGAVHTMDATHGPARWSPIGRLRAPSYAVIRPRHNGWQVPPIVRTLRARPPGSARKVASGCRGSLVCTFDAEDERHRPYYGRGARTLTEAPDWLLLGAEIRCATPPTQWVGFAVHSMDATGGALPGVPAKSLLSAEVRWPAPSAQWVKGVVHTMDAAAEASPRSSDRRPLHTELRRSAPPT